jgi:hypothetical protein
MNRLAVAALAATTIVVACAEDKILEPRTPVPSLRTSANLSGPSTANATVTWLGEHEDELRGVPLAINASGAIVGQSGISHRGLIFRPPPIRTIPTVDGGFATASAINDAGLITGLGGFLGNRAIVGDLQGPASFLPTLPAGWGIEWGNDISNAGDVVGASRMASGFNVWHATLWRFTGSAYEPIDLRPANDVGFADNSDAYGIAPGLSGANTLIVGSVGSAGNSPTQAFMWRNGVTTLLPRLPESTGYWIEASDVADNGMGVGFDQDNAVLWHDGQVIDLHPACEAVLIGRSGGSRAHAIALTSSVPSRVLIVGSCAGLPVVWYDAGQGGYVAELLPLIAGDIEGIAYDVNASGQIVGYTRQSVFAPSFAHHAVLWTFTPPPLRSDNRPPVAAAGPDQTVECLSHEGTNVVLDGTGSNDSDGTITKYEWFAGGTLVASGARPTVLLGLGVHSLRLVVTDDDGATHDDDVVIAVRDTRAPEVSLSASPGSLWPPNHKYHSIEVSASATDICDASLVIRGSVVSSESDEDESGDGDHAADIRVTRSDGSVVVSSNAAPTVAFNPLAGDRLELRAERKGDGPGRTYTITLTVTDGSGNSSARTFVITVPHDRAK